MECCLTLVLYLLSLSMHNNKLGHRVQLLFYLAENTGKKYLLWFVVGITLSKEYQFEHFTYNRCSRHCKSDLQNKYSCPLFLCYLKLILVLIRFKNFKFFYLHLLWHSNFWQWHWSSGRHLTLATLLPSSIVGLLFSLDSNLLSYRAMKSRDTHRGNQINNTQVLFKIHILNYWYNWLRYIIIRGSRIYWYFYLRILIQFYCFLHWT